VDQISLFLAHLAVLLLAPIELGLVAWYLLHWDLFPKYSMQRLLPLFVLILSGIGVPLLQAFAYRVITSVTKINDLFVGATIFFQSMLAVALGFYLLFKRRSASKDTKPLHRPPGPL
jgi:hypothetical protein